MRQFLKDAVIGSTSLQDEQAIKNLPQFFSVQKDDYSEDSCQKEAQSSKES